MIAYFSMEIWRRAADSDVCRWSGGAGRRHGRAAADLGLPLVAVTLLHRKGYLRQRLDAAGRQREEPTEWDVASVLDPLNARVTVTVECPAASSCARGSAASTASTGRLCRCRCSFSTPTSTRTRRRTARSPTTCTAATPRYRLAQEAVLGIGGVRMLRALGTGHLDDST